MKTRHLIIGAGDIGQAILEAIQSICEAQVRDKESDVTGQFDYIHICFTYFDRFIDEVKKYDQEYSPNTIIVHSTVPVGTIRALGEKAVHIPIRGRHPMLAGSIRTFKMYVGGNDPKRIQEVAGFFRQINLDVLALDNHHPETTEILKLMDTSYFAWNILFEKEMKRICDEYKVPLEIVYQDANNSYNAGYTATGQSHFVRPVLKHMPGPIGRSVLDHMPGPIGGHCIIPNAELFPETYINQLILKKNKEFKEEIKPETVAKLPGTRT